MVVSGAKKVEMEIRPESFTDIYDVLAEIGRGKFAVVKRCVQRSSGVHYAAKFLHKRRRGRDCRQEALHEIDMLLLTHDNKHIIDLVEVFETPHDLVLVTEYVGGGELFQFIDVEGRIDELTTVRLMQQILEGVACLHSNNILHMDIKPQNILLTGPLPGGDIKLCDLGLARPFNSGADILEIVGTLDYVAPEVLDYVSLDSSCDMWSVGVLAYVMLTGCSPFAGDSRQETLLNISQVNLDFPAELFDNISPLAQDFIRRLLVRNTRSRMTAVQCLEHAWFNNSAPTSQLSLTPDSATADDLSSSSSASSASSLSPATDASSITDCVESSSRESIPSSTDDGISTSAVAGSITDSVQSSCGSEGSQESISSTPIASSITDCVESSCGSRNSQQELSTHNLLPSQCASPLPTGGNSSDMTSGNSSDMTSGNSSSVASTSLLVAAIQRPGTADTSNIPPSNIQALLTAGISNCLTTGNSQCCISSPSSSPSLPRCRISAVFDSPSGQRRTLTATLNNNEQLTNHEPTKKCRCDLDLPASLPLSTSLPLSAAAAGRWTLDDSNKENSG